MQKRVHDYVVADQGTAQEALDQLIAGLDRDLRGRRQALARTSRAVPPAARDGRVPRPPFDRSGFDASNSSSLDRCRRRPPRAPRRGRVARRVRGLSDRAIAWLFIAPTIVLLLAINIFPLIWTIQLSFTNYRANRPNAEVEGVGLRNYVRLLTDEDIWIAMQITAHFVFWTILLQTRARLRPRLSDRPQIPRPRVLDHGHPDPDDAVAGGGGQLLAVPLPAADRALQLHRLLLHRHPALVLRDARDRSRWRPGRSSSSIPGCGRPT